MIIQDSLPDGKQNISACVPVRDPALLRLADRFQVPQPWQEGWQQNVASTLKESGEAVINWGGFVTRPATSPCPVSPEAAFQIAVATLYRMDFPDRVSCIFRGAAQTGRLSSAR
ncbi:MAG: hypothetical protein KDJ90_09075 [Nitratireductor sp.]|nr:hypothetical protein [Nitratireductor sp.]